MSTRLRINREVRIPVLDGDGAFKDNGDLYKVHSLSTDLALYAKTLNKWLSKFVHEAANSEGNYLWHPKAFRRNYER